MAKIISRVLIFAESLDEAIRLIPEEIQAQVKEKLLEKEDKHRLLFIHRTGEGKVVFATSSNSIRILGDDEQIDITGIIVKKYDVRQLYLFVVKPYPNFGKLCGGLTDVTNNIVGLDIGYGDGTYYVEFEVPIIEIGENKNA